VTFYRDSTAPIESPVRRSTGLGFAKTPAYWRVDSVVPASPADIAGVQRGDLIVRINGEPVEQWNLLRFEELARTAARVDFTFLEGRTETVRSIDVFDLVP
jgi:C-terminal processing protease CtpA/Prc